MKKEFILSFMLVVFSLAVLMLNALASTSQAADYTHREDGTILQWDGRVIPTQPKLLNLRDQHELRVKWLRVKHQRLLGMMRKHKVDMWIIPEGTFDRDPLTHYIAPTRAFSHGVTHIFVDTGKEGLKRFSSYLHPNETYAEIFTQIPEDYDNKLREIVQQYQPQKIALAYNGGRGHNSSLTYDAYQYISNALGEEVSKRFVPAKDLIEEYVDSRLEDEWKYYQAMVVATDRLAQRAFSNEVIVPGVTTTADLKWWFDQEMASWQVNAEPWFTTNSNIQRFDPKTGKIAYVAGPNGYDGPDDRPYQPGDVINIDCGISYLGFKTDIQRIGYILHEGESDVPEGLKQALKNRNTIVRAYRAARPGLTGRQAAGQIEKLVGKTDFEYNIGSHSIGYHGHALGPGLRSTASEVNPQRENLSPLRLGSYMSVEGQTISRIPEWNNQKIVVGYEEQGYLTEQGYQFFIPLQTRWFVVRSDTDK